MFYINTDNKRVNHGLQVGDRISMEINCDSNSNWLLLFNFYTQGTLKLYSTNPLYNLEDKILIGTFNTFYDVVVCINDYLENLKDILGVDVEIKKTFDSSSKKVFHCNLISSMESNKLIISELLESS